MDLAEKKFRDLETAFSRHRGLQSGEIPSETFEDDSRNVRFEMAKISQSLSFDLVILLSQEESENGT